MRVLQLFRSPAATFLLVAGIVGVLMVFLVPPFAGIDESGHFERAYQLSTGRLIPQSAVPGAAKGGGACLPPDIAAGVTREGARYAVHVLASQPGSAALREKIQQSEHASDAELAARLPKCPNGDRFATFATFAWYSPLAYLPQAIGVAIVRLFGGGVVGMLLLARLACLATYLAIVTIAIRRAPVGRWALCITALLPVAMFQSTTSVSPDAITTAVALLVISSALKMTADPAPKLARAALVEAVLLSIALGLCKPSYVVIALCYLLPLLGPRRKLSYWPLALAIGAGVAVSGLWQTTQSHLFVCDTGAFGAHLDPAQQRHDLVRNPLSLLGAGCRAMIDYHGKWAGDLVTVGDRVVDWRVGVAAVVLVGFLFLAVQRDPKQRFELHWHHRVFLAVIFVIAYFAVITGWIIYCESPPVHIGDPVPHARLFLPALALVPVAAELSRGRLGRLSAGRVPVSLLLVPFEVVWLVALTSQMR